MVWVKIERGVVIQKQPYDEDGFAQAPDNVICGYLYDGGKFTPPVLDQSVKKPSEMDIRIAALEIKVGITKEDKDAAKDALMQTTQEIEP